MVTLNDPWRDIVQARGDILAHVVTWMSRHRWQTGPRASATQ